MSEASETNSAPTAQFPETRLQAIRRQFNQCGALPEAMLLAYRMIAEIEQTDRETACTFCMMRHPTAPRVFLDD